jgi:hypothetical protein
MISRGFDFQARISAETSIRTPSQERLITEPANRDAKLSSPTGFLFPRLLLLKHHTPFARPAINSLVVDNDGQWNRDRIPMPLSRLF